MDQANTKKVSFYQKFKPLVVMIPAIFAIHYGWFLLQKDERIVPKSEQLTELPVITASRKVFNYLKSKAQANSGDNKSDSK